MEKEKEKIVNPEGHKYGNFINYYNFHPAEERIQQLPTNIWISRDSTDHKYSALDIGCNVGVNSNLLFTNNLIINVNFLFLKNSFRKNLVSF